MTSSKIVWLLKVVGMMKVHLSIVCSLIVRPCYYNVDTSSSIKLISIKMGVEELRQFTRSDFGGIIDNAMSVEATYEGVV